MQNHHQSHPTKLTCCRRAFPGLSPAHCFHGHRCAQIQPFSRSCSLVCRLCKTNLPRRPVGVTFCSFCWPVIGLQFAAQLYFLGSRSCGTCWQSPTLAHFGASATFPTRVSARNLWPCQQPHRHASVDPINMTFNKNNRLINLKSVILTCCSNYVITLATIS